MTSRRQFLQIGITATAWPIVARAADAAGVGPRQDTPLLGVVYDTRFAESAAFGRRSAALGLRAHAIDGDMTRLWYDEIYYQWQQRQPHHWQQRHPHQWQERPTALAGLTAHGPMFCFAELARDVGMRVVFRAEHRPTGGGAMAHTFTGPVPMLSTALDACGRPESLWTAMADVVARCPSGRTEIASEGRTVLTAPPEAGTLYTWVIAPVVKAQAKE